ncbi:fatty acid hydroxylase [Pseudopedobacter saltans DSM 12145]|uniref:Fatty acid hydroxylase n=1 Tax=Pseudopedobacter saltans (strain ATCC 51119 / DSM 12145 / JCM 21818 / CCUG 39354 / LMG 10337 / NBRC 100064 / NCIMB 13643) TaxID=762903 RepID=F0S4J6_PSESL|nr:sterol desaturase family protein [Pseudopedobacter saltans]ADY51987.1 fatty acid hydroxylase [Pseudopedobacter saltans DSM 12145]
MNIETFFGEQGVSYVYLYTAPIHIAVILFEMIYSYKYKKHIYDTKDTATNVYMALLNFGLDLVMKAFAMGVMFFFYDHSLFNLSASSAWYWLGVFLLQDFAYYIHHYVDHHSRLFWAVHVTHHNSEKFNISTGFRSPVFQPLYRYLFFSPIALLGFNPWHIMSAYAIFQIYGTWVHTTTVGKLGILEWFLVTPSHHRVHHASNARYLDRNMGMGLIIWDRIFGTFEKEDENYEPIKYGLTKDIEDKGPINIVFHEWKEIYKDAWKQPGLKFSDRLKYMFYPPGWNHRGDGKTSAVLRAQEKAERLSKTNNEKIRKLPT